MHSCDSGNSWGIAGALDLKAEEWGGGAMWGGSRREAICTVFVRTTKVFSLAFVAKQIACLAMRPSSKSQID